MKTALKVIGQALLLVGVLLLMIGAVVLGASTARAAEPLRSWEVAKEVAFAGELLVDYKQTKSIHGWCDGRVDCTIHETNPLLGVDPSNSRIAGYFIGSLVGHAAVTYLLPREYRGLWQNGTLALELGVLAHNYHLGLKANF